MLILLAETGLRRAEVRNLNLEDIGWRERRIIIRNGKGNKTRLVPMTTALVRLMEGVAIGRREGPLFASRNGGPLSVRQINRIVAEAGRRAGIQNPNPKYRYITPHLLRHSFARAWKDGGGNIEALSKIMGHASVKTTWDLYGTLGEADLQREYHKIVKSFINDSEASVASLGMKATAGEKR